MCWPKPICNLGGLTDPVQDFLKGLDAQLIDAYTDTLTSLGTFWVRSKTPDLTGGAAANLSGHAEHAGNIETILGYVTWIGLGLAVVSLIALGAMVAARMRSGEGIVAVGKAGAVLGGVIGLSTASAIVTHALPNGPHGVGGATGFIQASLWWYMAAAAAASVIIGAIKMIWEQRAQPGRETLRSLLTLIIVAGAGVTIINMLITAADSFSVWVIDKAMTCSPGDQGCFVNSVKHIVKFTDDVSTGSGLLLALLIGLLALLTDLIQIILIVARSAMLVLLAGVLPIAASATNTEMGRMWFKRCIAWLTGFLLYKPVASLIYAAAFKLVTNDLRTHDELLDTLTGAMLMLLAVLALPALLRFVAPMASAASSGHGAGALAMTAMATRLPSGARATGAGASQPTQTTTSTTTATQSPTGSAVGGSAVQGSAGTGPASVGAIDSASPAAAGTGTGSATATRPNEGAGQPANWSVVTKTETTNQPDQPSRGRRYSAPSGGGARLVQAAAAAAAAAHAITEEATGAQR